MLKIKDNFDLKKLGCDLDEEDFIWNFKELLFYKDTRIILSDQFFNSIGNIRLDILYDLINAGLVEKVGDNEDE